MAKIEFILNFPDLADLIRRNKREIDIVIAASMQTNRGMLFDKEGAHNGHEKWADLAFRSGQILSRRGDLRKSLAPRGAKGSAGPNGYVTFASDFIAIGTNLLYARMMNDGTTKMPGGVLKAKGDGVLKIPIPQGRSANEAAKNVQRDAIMRQINREQRKNVKNIKGLEKRDARVNALNKRLLEADEGKGPVRFIFRKSVRIPARPYDDWTEQDAEEMSITLANKLKQLIKRGM